MHDIAIIRRQNIEASQRSAREQYALLLFQGVTLVSVQGVGNDRNTALDRLTAAQNALKLGERVLLRPPLQPQRDQSEDRGVAVVPRTQAQLMEWAGA